MTSETTRNRLLDAAERTFAQYGYRGASVRTITAEAGVDLGSVRYHFGSKDGLFGEVLRRRLDPLYQERMERLEAVERASDPPVLEDIIAALLEPGLRLVRDKHHGRLWMRLIAWARLEPGEYLVSVQETHRTLLERFRTAFQRALPDLPEAELGYRFYFLFVNLDGTLRAFADFSEDPSEDVVERLIHFVAAGMRAPLVPTGGRRGAPAAEENVADGLSRVR